MSPIVIGIIGLIVLFLLMAMGMPIGVSFLLVGVVGTAVLSGFDVALSSLARIPYSWASAYVFSCVPLFIFMGIILSRTGVASDLFRSANLLLGRLPGGLAVASVAGCAGFAAVSGSSTAGAAAMASICFPEMRKYKYSDKLGSGVIAAGGALGIMIPPSLGFIVYGILSDQSISQLFIAGIIPGVLQALFYIIAVFIVVKLHPSWAPSGMPRVPLRDKLSSLLFVWPIFAIFAVVIGGIYLGIFTPTEAGGVGAGASLILTAAMRRLPWKVFLEICTHTVHITAMIFLLLMGAMLFNVFLTLSHLPQALSGLFGSIGSPHALVILILFLYIPLGCFMDVTSMFILTIPLFLPALLSGGVNLIWVGVLLVLNAEIGLLTPPVGMNVFVVQGVLRDVPVENIFTGVIPFVIANFFLLVLLYLFPGICLFLPNLMK